MSNRSRIVQRKVTACTGFLRRVRWLRRQRAIGHAEVALRLSPRARVGTTVGIIGPAHLVSRRFDAALGPIAAQLSGIGRRGTDGSNPAPSTGPPASQLRTFSIRAPIGLAPGDCISRLLCTGAALNARSCRASRRSPTSTFGIICSSAPFYCFGGAVGRGFHSEALAHSGAREHLTAYWRPC